MPYANDAAVEAGNARNSYENRGIGASAVQGFAVDTATGLSVDSMGLASVLDAAAWLGIEPKRLRGYIVRNGLDDPIGDFDRVYPASLLRTRQRLEARA